MARSPESTGPGEPRTPPTLPDMSMVRTLRPRDYNEVLYVGHFYRKGQPVVMDLTGMSDTDARPLVDFAAGLVFGRCGDMDRIAHKVFLLVPPGMIINTG
ncbi:cell division protein SepF [Sphaerisporangium sp. B11E5]